MKLKLLLSLLLLWGAYSAAIYQTFGSEGNLANAVAYAESSMDPRAVNLVYPDASIGLFQINLNQWAGVVPGRTWQQKTLWLEDPLHNISLAYKIRWCYFGGCSGWGQWGSVTSGRYQQYL